MDDDTRYIWSALLMAGARVPLDPTDLDATHLILAGESGVDVRGIIEAVAPRSGDHLQTA